MQKSLIFLLAIAATITAYVVFGGTHKKPDVAGGIATMSATSAEDASVPLPTESPIAKSGEDVIRMFFQFIHSRRIPDAIALMDVGMVPTDSEKQQYGVVFDAFASVSIDAIRPETVGAEDMEPGTEKYRVDLSVSLNPDDDSGLWENGKQIRWISVKKDGDGFLIHEIATGP